MIQITPLLVVIFFALLAGRNLLAPGYFNMHDDLQMMRQFQMEKCFLDGQIPCRWVPDMGYGFGFSLFNFYPPLPYLIGEVFRVLQFSFVDTVKLTFLLSFIASGIAMYFLSRQFFGGVGGILSAIFYVWAPYHAVDVYVRGAMNEAWALIFFPAILLFSYRLISNFNGEARPSFQISNFLGLALSWAGLLLSHNLMVLIFAPVFAGWCLLWMYRSKKSPSTIYHLPSTLWHLVLSGVLALALSAFFTLPAIFEQKYVQVNTLVTGYYEYIAHFVSLNQLLISRFWGYGPSVWGTNDGMPFQIGHIHWILSLILGIFLVLKLLKNKNLFSDYELLAISYLLLVGWFAAFMAHPRSTPIWQLVPFLKFVQFPWRFLALVILSFSFTAGSLVLIAPKKLVYWIAGILVTGLLMLNWNYFKPERMGPLTDSEKFSKAAWELQQTAGIYDYLPSAAREAPKEPRKMLAEVIGGEGLISEAKQGTNWASFKTTIRSSGQATIRLNIFKFPDWKVLIDRNEVVPFVPQEEKWGRMWLKIPAGVHTVDVRLENTPIRTAANLVSLISWTALLSFPLWRKKLSVSS